MRCWKPTLETFIAAKLETRQEHCPPDLLYPGEVGCHPAVEAREFSPPAAVAGGHNAHSCPGESAGVLVEESPATVSSAGIAASLGMSGTQQASTSQAKLIIKFYFIGNSHDKVVCT